MSMRQDHDPQSAASDPLFVRARGLFERASDRLDAASTRRLRSIRRDALAAPARRSLAALLPVGAAAAAAVALAIAWLPGRPANLEQPTPMALETAQDAYLADDDADIYAWLAEAPVATDARREGTL